MNINIDNHIQSKHLQDVMVFHFDIVFNLEKRKRMTEKKGERSMAGKIKNCSLFSRLLMFWMVVMLGTIAPAAAASDELEATRQEVKQLRQMVQELANEVNRLKDVKGQEEDFRAQYQDQLQEIREDVTKLNESPLGGLESTLGKLKFGGYGEIHSNFTEGSESDKMDFTDLFCT
jgi:DNA repair exonuclease SbcCD ATPase subunit